MAGNEGKGMDYTKKLISAGIRRTPNATTVMARRSLIEGLRTTFNSGRTLSLSFRERQLDRFLDMLKDNFDAFSEAAGKDLRKPKFESGGLEVQLVICEVKQARKELRNWDKRKKLPVNLVVLFDSACIKRDPYGVTLIIGPWNYPIMLPLQPLVGAIAGGNCALIKPSEHSPHVSTLIAELIPKYLDSDCYKVVLGNAQDTIQLLENKFDYIFATSSTCIGKSVMQAASKHLTPCTLELGGKSPVYIDDDAHLEYTTKRIIWGKGVNLGQTCIAPDYILCSKMIESEIVELAKKYVKEMYGENPKMSPDLTRVVNANHFKRLSKLLDGTKGKIVMGGERDSEDLYISPTIVVDVKPDDVLMQDEIFGPILPFVTVKCKEEAMTFIKSRPKPLSLYVFSKSTPTLDYFIDNTSSGSVCCNDVVIQNGWDGLPFGGVGDSGIGRYHGRYTYETFTHEKAVVIRDFSKIGEVISGVRYPPYTERNMKIIAKGSENFAKFNLPQGTTIGYILSFLFGVASTMMVGAKWMFDKKRGN